MIKSPVSSLASQCGSCRSAYMKAFATFAATSTRSHFQPISLTPCIARFAAKEPFRTSASCRSYLASHQDKHDYTIGPREGSEAEPETPKDISPETPPITPWYLHVDRLQHAEPVFKRSWLPELPEKPPPLMQPMLEYISIDLGLDALSVLDLRKLDPPPGLGANLLMVLATARSEKHLHVSADRFCRWLRSLHKLSPYADGLMGRGELKLKLRRKARRAKLLSSVGSSDSINMDDGLRTGWICVNVGSIDSAESAPEISQELETFVGFGGQVKGTKLVVQMMTVEKREELNLEELWGTALSRQEKREAKLSKKNSEMSEELGLHSSETESISSEGPSLATTSHLAASNVNH